VRSYLAGLLVADRLTSRLGITTPPSESDLTAITSSAVIAPDTPWDPESFKDGVRDVSATDGTLTSLMATADRELPPHHGALVLPQLGVPFLADRLNQVSP
jgi:hypothetical protein